MAKRMLHSNITTSDKIGLVDDFDEVLYNRLMIFTDSWGCVKYAVGYIKDECFPLKRNNPKHRNNSVTYQQIEISLKTQISNELLIHLLDDGIDYLFFKNFKTFQELRPDRLGISVITGKKEETSWNPLDYCSQRNRSGTARTGLLEVEVEVEVKEEVKRKEKEKKKKKKTDLKIKPEKLSFGEHKNVFLTQDENSKLLNKLDENIYELVIEKLSNFKKSNSKTYDSDYGAINTWVITSVEEDVLKKQRFSPQKTKTESLMEKNDEVYREALRRRGILDSDSIVQEAQLSISA